MDNMLMNLLTLRLAAAIVGKRLRSYVALPVAAAGAGYALLSLTVAPILYAAPAKLMFGAAMAAVLICGRRSYWKCLLALYLSAFLMGGLMLSLTLLLGCQISGGALMGTVPLRVMLLAAALCAALPRLVRTLIGAYRHRVRHVRLRVELSDRMLCVWALVDSGNLLTEPVSGLPVVVFRPGLLPRPIGGRPVPYAAMGKDGWLNAFRPRRICVKLNEWTEIDAYIAESEGALGAEEAVIGANIWQSERRMLIDNETQDAAWEAVAETAPDGQEGAPVYSFGGDSADAVLRGGGGALDRKTDAEG